MSTSLKIPVVVVDDQEVDRYLVKRHLKRDGNFGELVEMTTGEVLLQRFFSEPTTETDEPLLLLVDINMPGLDGFETIEEMQRRMDEGMGPKNVVVMMITSSGNLKDRNRADQLGVVKGFISKPLDQKGVQQILDQYNICLGLI